jgi:hypothetical protein
MKTATTKWSDLSLSSEERTSPPNEPRNPC